MCGAVVHNKMPDEREDSSSVALAFRGYPSVIQMVASVG